MRVLSLIDFSVMLGGYCYQAFTESNRIHLTIERPARSSACRLTEHREKRI